MSVDAILCADLHIRMTTPVCRTDDYFEAVKRKLYWLSSLQSKYDCPVVCAGDVFDSALPSCEHGFKLLQTTTELLPCQFWTIAGQHDIAYHSMENYPWSPLALVLRLKAQDSGLLNPNIQMSGRRVAGFHFGQDPKECNKDVDILVLHTLVWDREKPYPGAPETGNARTIMSRYKNTRLIVTGDNHKPCVVRKGEQLLVNCGSMMRMDVDQADYHPCVYLWDATKNDVEEAYYPIEEGVVDTKSHRKLKEKEERLDDFASSLQPSKEGLTLDFRANVESRLNSIQDDRVKGVVVECLENGAG